MLPTIESFLLLVRLKKNLLAVLILDVIKHV
jgi:hypothetical protein